MIHRDCVSKREKSSSSRALGCSLCVAHAIRRGDLNRLRELLSLPVEFKTAFWEPLVTPLPSATSNSATSSHLACHHPKLPVPALLPLEARRSEFAEDLVHVALAEKSSGPLRVLAESGRFNFNAPLHIELSRDLQCREYRLFYEVACQFDSTRSRRGVSSGTREMDFSLVIVTPVQFCLLLGRLEHLALLVGAGLVDINSTLRNDPA